MNMDIELKYRIKFDQLHLNSIIINGIKYTVEITNYDSRMGIFFYSQNVNEDFSILIDKGVALRRRVERPNHDHDDYEYLQALENPEWAKPRVDAVEFGTRTSKL